MGRLLHIQNIPLKAAAFLTLTAFSIGPDRGAVSANLDSVCRHAMSDTSQSVRPASFNGRQQPDKLNVNEWEYWQIVYPVVDSPATLISGPAIPAYSQIEIGACGCVQTGGSGQTWKRYVNPTGPNTDRFYHGVVLIPGARQMHLPVSPTFRGDFVRISDLIAAQNGGFRWKTTVPLPLILGYEDDDFKDNNYLAHDNGDGGQCAQYHAAAVSVVLTGISH